MTPFTGTARRLDDKPCTQSVQETSSSTPKEQQTENETKKSNFKTRKPGKLVFGSNVNVPKASTKVSVLLLVICVIPKYLLVNDVIYQIFNFLLLEQDN